MRKVLIVLALTAAVVAASANEAFAQRRWGRGGRNSSVGVGVYIGNGGYYGRGYGYYGGRYYSPYNYTDSYYADPIVQVPANDIRPSYYSPSATQQTATVTVLVPRADAKVWFDGAPTSQTGMERRFYTPALDSGTYTYTVRARWMENGQPMERERRVNVQPGQSTTVSFQEQSGESLRLPK